MHDAKVGLTILPANPLFKVFRMNSNKHRLQNLWLSAFLVVTAITSAQPTFVPVGNPIDVAEESYGNKAIRMVLNAADEPVVSFGNNGNLYVVKWLNDLGMFTSPTAIDPNANVYMSDAEGPQMAGQGDNIVLTYMLSGQWDTGARSVSSTDGGLTWGDPVEMVPDATEDHFMPCVGMDDDANPFAGVKVGNNPASIYEGILRSEDGGASWLPAVDASALADGDAVCECCPSQPFYANERYYDLVRNNNANVRDFWLLSSADGILWDSAVDIDPVDWVISSCPASGPAITGPLADGTWLTAYMSAGGISGQSRIYLSSLDLGVDGGVWLGTEAITVSQFDNATQNNPSLASWDSGIGSTLVALAWEQNTGGYDIQLALSSVGAGESQSSMLTDVAVNLTSEWNGQHRRPIVALSSNEAGETQFHLVWQHSADGTVKYWTGYIAYPTDINPVLAPQQPTVTIDRVALHVDLPASWRNSTWNAYDMQGRLLCNGKCSNPSTEIALPPSHSFILSIEASNGHRWARAFSGIAR